jgi:hypothetical protein
VKIEYLNRKEIDDRKWDEVIARSPAETLYPYSWYLDAATDRWSALVMGDYRFIMPLVWKKKCGVRYLYQPLYCQQLGVFSREVTDPLLVNRFIDQTRKRFRFGVVHFNVQNLVGDHPRYRVEDRSNYVLSLEGNYEELNAGYSVNARRNLKRALEAGGELVRDTELEDLITLKSENALNGIPGSVYRQIRKQFGAVITRGKGKIYGLRNEGRLVAAAFMAFSGTRIIYLQSISGENGKERRAMFRIVDQVIRDNAGSGMKLDFEGSNIPSIARFFGGFGAKPEIYQSLSFNRFPIPLIP